MPGTTTQNLIPLHFLPLVFIVVALSELQARRISNGTVCLVLLIALARMLFAGTGPMFALGGAAAAGRPIVIAASIRPGSVGAGDRKLAAALGALVGPGAAMAWLLVACAMALLASRFTKPEAGYEAGVHFGPYLVAGAFIVCVSPPCL